MKPLRYIILLVLLAATPAWAQTAKTRASLYTDANTALADTGETAITPEDLRTLLKNVVASSYNPLTDGSPGVGTVTTFSSGNLSPLFTASVATATSTPALTFSLSTAAQNYVFAGPATGGTGAPAYRALVAADIPSLTLAKISDAGTMAAETAASYSTTAQIAAAYQPLDGDLTTFAGITPSANVQTLLGAADFAAVRTSLGLVIGTNVQAYDADLTTFAGISPTANVQTLLGAADFAAVRTSLGLVIGTNVQAYDADLTTFAGISPTANVQTLLGAADFAAVRTSLGLVIGTNVQAYDADLTTYAGITPSANVQTLLGAADFSAFRTSLGVAIGTNVQAYDADLTTYAGITPAANVQSLLGAADYAAIKGLLDLEIGTDVQAYDAALTVLAGGSDFVAFSGPTTSTKTFTLPNASATVLTDNAAVTVAQGGTGATTLTANNVILGNGTSAVQFVAPGTIGNVLTSNGTTWTSEASSGGGTDITDFTKLEANVIFGATSSNYPNRLTAIGTGTLAAFFGNDFHGLEFRTGTTSGWGYGWAFLSGGSATNIFDLDGGTVWSMKWRIQTGSSVADYRMVVGAVGTMGAAVPADGIGVRFDTAVPDTNFRLVAWSGSTPTLGTDNLGAPAANTTYDIRIWCTGDGTVHATVNGGTESTLSTGFTSTRVVPYAHLINNTTADKRLRLGRLAFKVEGLAP